MAESTIDFFKETEHLLEQWGRWCRADGNSIGFPGIAPFAKEIPDGWPDPPQLAMMTDEEAGEIEKSMLLLRECHLLAYKISIHRYVGRNTLLIAATKTQVGYSKARELWKFAVFFNMGNLYKNITLSSMKRAGK